MCFHEQRGAVSEAHRVAQLAGKLPLAHGKPFFTIFKLAEAYFCCFMKGRWVAAIEAVITTLDELYSWHGNARTEEQVGALILFFFGECALTFQVYN